jgi:drug/metabolite transporter (DMT)-like permease
LATAHSKDDFRILRRFDLKNSLRADLYLLFATFLWGTTFPIIREALKVGDSLAFVAQRFLVAGVLGLAVLMWVRRSLWALRLWWLPTLGLAVFNGLGFWTQSVGLETVHSSRAAFLTGFYVVLVPMTLRFFGLGRPTPADWWGVGLALLGLYVFTDPQVSGWSAGDLWVLASALSFALGINLLQKLYGRAQGGGLEIAVLQMGWTGLGAGLGWISFSTIRIPVDSVWLSAVVYCAVFATVLALWIQTHFQRQTTPTRVALVFSLEPVFAALIAWVGWGETLSSRSILGACILLLGVVWMELARSKSWLQGRIRIEP